ncbi:hypothetical protein KKJ09_13235 [Xenorhabdus bovienii]|uniref:hypothetical protein n=1 Tax=Xenorhabdus bovienii TaxID=40576 RepID=UPI0023B3570A|nr:hypothetical protein [Xenorhabdus bovienii]MDE9494523.1 hypothetical protein [Xenorhabdus bovienii]MDE9502920.1 hypothetical protein [Xenorhabdus bovienii]MDE9526570.1 hypothetical protein [Xenorhabdus bovienii]MDE9568831.1 hypothetical protein [Xenorhabdus bovienii]
MAKLLNLDAISPKPKEVVLRGVCYELSQMTVGLFAIVQQLQTQGIENQSLASQLVASTDIVRKLIPTMSESEIDNLTPDQVQSIVVFAFQEGEETNEKHAGEDAK